HAPHFEQFHLGSEAAAAPARGQTRVSGPRGLCVAPPVVRHGTHLLQGTRNGNTARRADAAPAAAAHGRWARTADGGVTTLATTGGRTPGGRAPRTGRHDLDNEVVGGCSDRQWDWSRKGESPVHDRSALNDADTVGRPLGVRASPNPEVMKGEVSESR